MPEDTGEVEPEWPEYSIAEADLIEVRQTATTGPPAEPEEARSQEDVREQAHKYPDPRAEVYIEALLKELDKLREERYAHLPNAWF